jgi:hypothetical protein
MNSNDIPSQGMLLGSWVGMMVMKMHVRECDGANQDGRYLR